MLISRAVCYYKRYTAEFGSVYKCKWEQWIVVLLDLACRLTHRLVSSSPTILFFLTFFNLPYFSSSLSFTSPCSLYSSIMVDSKVEYTVEQRTSKVEYTTEYTTEEVVEQKGGVLTPTTTIQENKSEKMIDVSEDFDKNGDRIYVKSAAEKALVRKLDFLYVMPFVAVLNFLQVQSGCCIATCSPIWLIYHVVFWQIHLKLCWCLGYQGRYQYHWLPIQLAWLIILSRLLGIPGMFHFALVTTWYCRLRYNFSSNFD